MDTEIGNLGMMSGIIQITADARDGIVGSITRIRKSHLEWDTRFFHLFTMSHTNKEARIYLTKRDENCERDCVRMTT